LEFKIKNFVTQQIIATTTKCISTSTIDHFNIIFPVSNEYWYEQKWMIALIGALSGVFITFLLEILRDYYKKYKTRKIMAKNMFNEVLTIKCINEREVVEDKKYIEKFKKISENTNNYPLNGPNTDYTGKYSMDFYKSHLKDLGLFNQQLSYKIFLFYEYYKSIHASAKILSDRFKRYYKGDATTGSQDIIKYFEKEIKQKMTLDIIGAEVLANLVYKYRVGTEKKDKELEKKKNKLKKYLKKVKKGDVVKIRELSDMLKIDIITCVVILLKQEKFENISIGQYKKIN